MIAPDQQPHPQETPETIEIFLLKYPNVFRCFKCNREIKYWSDDYSDPWPQKDRYGYCCNTHYHLIIGSSASIAAAARAEEAREERERVLDKLDYFVCSCQELHAPDCNGSEEGIKDCDGCGMFESATIEQIREYIKELR